MTWTSIGSLSLKTSWEFTEPTEGEFFRFQHSGAPPQGVFLISQAEITPNGVIDVCEPRIFQADSLPGIIHLPKPSAISSRRIGIRRLPPNPTLESQIRTIFRSALLTDSRGGLLTQTGIRAPWSVEIEVSDVVTPPLVSLASLESQVESLAEEVEAIVPQIETLASQVESIVPHIQALLQSNFSNVVLLMHMDGSHGTTNFVDVKGKTVTANGNCAISTQSSRFGGSSAYFDGDGDYLEVAIGADFDVANIDFTIEAFINHSSASGSQCIIGTAGGNAGYGFFFGLSSSKPYFEVTGGAGVAGSYDVSLTTWHHYALSVVSNNFYFAVDGQVERRPKPGNWLNSGLLKIGVLGHPSFPFPYTGYLDGLRITKGIARYTSNFTPPASPFPNF